MDTLTINKYKETIKENLKIICMTLKEFGISTLDNMNIEDLKKLNNDVNIEYNDFFGIN